MKELSKEEEDFCVKYFESGNAVKAFKEMGYLDKTDNEYGCMRIKILKKANVQRRIRELALEKSTSDGIVRLDSDDLIEKMRLEIEFLKIKNLKLYQILSTTRQELKKIKNKNEPL